MPVSLKGPDDLRKQLAEMDGRNYPSYKRLAGSCDFGEFRLHLDHVQGDPFAPPSRVRVAVPHNVCRFPSSMRSTRACRIALADFVARRVHGVIEDRTKGRRGTGGSGKITIDVGGQQVLERSAVAVTDEWVEVRLAIGLPGYGRRVAAKEADEILFVEIPRIVREGMLFDAKTSDVLSEHISSVVTQRALRDQLAERRLVAFIADGSILPRSGGGSQLPMDPEVAVLFESCEGLRVSLALPGGGEIPGMGIPEGVTVIVGGGYHGKSTLLDAIRTGIYDHIPGDGREAVVTRPDCASIRAEDGRRVQRVDISPFIRDLPSGASTAEFTSEDSSGSTSQAANLVEALETGVTLLLIDEDTAATNFMVRDARMRELIPDDKEPIVPFVDCVRGLYEQHGVSTLLVTGGCGDYLGVADTVIMMDAYHPLDATARARETVGRLAVPRPERAEAPIARMARVPDPASVDPSRGRSSLRIQARGMDSVVFGEYEICFRRTDMLVDESQLRAIGEAVEYAKRAGHMDGSRPLAEVVALVERDIMSDGVERVSPHFGQHPGALAEFRRHDLAIAINRLPTLSVRAEAAKPEEPQAAPARKRSRSSTRRPSRRGGSRKKAPEVPSGGEPAGES